MVPLSALNSSKRKDSGTNLPVLMFNLDVLYIAACYGTCMVMARESDRSKPQKRGLRTRKHPSNENHPQKKSVNALKSKIRDLERVLGRSDRLPPDVQIEKERAFAGYKNDLQNVTAEKKKQKMISKYHKIRFFERQKAARRLKKLQKLSNSDDTEGLNVGQSSEAMNHAQINLNYTIYYPLTEKYVSLFRGSGEAASTGEGEKTPGEESNDKILAADLPMWEVVKKCTEEGTLELLRDGKLSSMYKNDSKASVSLSTGKDGGRGSAKRRQEKSQRSSDEESDGGFFET